MTAATPQAPTTLHGSYVLLRAGALRLLLPQHEVGAPAYLEAQPVRGAVPGLFELPDADAPTRDHRYIAIAEDMSLLPEFPSGRFLATSLGDSTDDLLSWCWDEVRVLPELELTPRNLPPVMRTPRSPIARFAELDAQVIFLCNARQLRGYALGLET